MWYILCLCMGQVDRKLTFVTEQEAADYYDKNVDKYQGQFGNYTMCKPRKQ